MDATMMEHTFFAAIGITFIFTVLTILVLKKWANKIRLVDMPGGRKQHALPTPIVGGIAMFIGLYAGLVYLPTVFLPYRSFMVIGMFILIVGILDDLHDISARIRLALQLVAVSFMIFWGHVCLEQLGGLFSEATFYLGYMAVPITLFGAATLINAVNMLDGIDGLAGSLSLIAFISLAAIASYSGQHQTALVLMLFSTAVLAYLVFNFPWWPARKAVVFMGMRAALCLVLP
jgi:UDP-GlcNAc:undecaprenyl-phosphate GlcNAc-1-phosphate transferase